MIGYTRSFIPSTSFTHGFPFFHLLNPFIPVRSVTNDDRDIWIAVVRIYVGVSQIFDNQVVAFRDDRLSMHCA
jgi:hypothetical protein